MRLDHYVAAGGKGPWDSQVRKALSVSAVTLTRVSSEHTATGAVELTAQPITSDTWPIRTRCR